MLVSDLAANLIIAQFFLPTIKDLGGTATFSMFAALAVFAWGLCGPLRTRNPSPPARQHCRVLAQRSPLAK
jgi:hypothetical protein